MNTCSRTDSIYLEDIGEFHSADEDSAYGPGILDMCPRDRLPIEKLEHLSLLIPSEFLIPPCITEPGTSCKTEAVVERHYCEPEEDDTDLDSENANC